MFSNPECSIFKLGSVRTATQYWHGAPVQYYYYNYNYSNNLHSVTYSVGRQRFTSRDKKLSYRLETGRQQRISL